MVETASPPNRAICFVDGSNFFHGLDEAGVHNQGTLSFLKIGQKVSAPRQLVAIRYYVGKIKQSYNKQLYADQRSFVARQEALDERISFYFGRMEERKTKNTVENELRDYLIVRKDLEVQTRKDLSRILNHGGKALVYVEKAVDVMLAVDLVLLAQRNEYDTAYIFSADGDYTPAVQFVRSLGKKVFAVSARSGAELAKSVDTFIPVKKDWFNDCYMD